MQAATKLRYDSFIAAYAANNWLRADLAAIKAGFAGSCAKQTAHRLVTTDYCKQVIAKIKAKMAAKTETTLETLTSQYRQAYKVAEDSKQPAAMVTATTGEARLYGFDKDNDMRGDQARELEESEKATADKMAELWRNNIVRAG